VRRQKKHVCGCEGMVAGKGSRTLAFVGWLFRFIFCLYAANFQLLLSFFRLCLTFGGMFCLRTPTSGGDGVVFALTAQVECLFSLLISRADTKIC